MTFDKREFFSWLSLFVWLSVFVLTAIFISPAHSQGEGQGTVISGGVEAFDQHSLIGTWKGHIKGLGRHPTVYIDSCENGQLSGTYKGLIGTFPLTGTFDESSHNLNIQVDFSKSKLLHLRRMKTATGLIRATVDPGATRLTGRANIAELGPREVAWEASKKEEK